MGQFVHAIRRNLNMVYIVMNNGCYGLTKGQDSATADLGSKSKAGSVNMFQTIDLAGLALELGAGFVAQSFSGDKTQLVPLIQAAMKYEGFAFINVISPCVTFNNNPGSTKSYDYVRQHIEATSTIDFVPLKEEIFVNYKEGSDIDIKMHDGSNLLLHKLESDWDPKDRISAVNALQKARDKKEILTGLIYFEDESQELHTIINTIDKPLNSLNEKELCPGSKVLHTINEGFK
jgi:2-oxoglutarate ferredoxin oxidoreductase subunit beta